MDNKSNLGFQSNLYKLKTNYDLNDFKVFELVIDDQLDNKIDRYRTMKDEIRLLLNNQIVSSYGHLIGFYNEEKEAVTQFIQNLRLNLSTTFQIEEKDIVFNELSIDEWLNDENVGLNLLKQIIGFKITEILKQKGFIKISSNKGAGLFKLPEEIERRSAYNWQEELGRNISFRYLDVGITIHNLNPEAKIFSALLLLDTITKLEGKFTLEERIKSILKNKSIDFNSEPDQWSSIVTKELGSQPTFKRVSSSQDETNELYLVEEIKETTDITFSYKYLRNKSMNTILNKLGYSNNGKWIAEVRDYRNKDPNVHHYWPCSILVQKIDSKSLKDKDQIFKYNKFAKITPMDRFNLVQEVIKLANLEEIIESNHTYKGYSYPYFTPFITNRFSNKPFGRFPRLTDTGVERWGNMKELYVIWGSSKNIDKARFDDFFNQVESSFRDIAKNTNEIAPKVIKVQQHSEDPGNFMDLIPKGKNVCLLIIGEGKHTYKDFKIQFTIKRDQAIQYIKRNTFAKMDRRYPMLVETLARQIIAKTGGLPYKLTPSNLPDTIIVGLDRARDSYSQKASASAGVAAVLPTGEYLTGISTKVDARRDDFIKVDDVAPPFLRQLKKINFKPKVAVILRDGSPATCKNEVPKWLEYLEKENIKLIFCASTKDHPYRVFPAFEEGKKDYEFPIGILNEPKNEKDFMVLTTMPPPNSGTPKPGLYTLMKNTTEKTDDEVKEMLLSIITSMSILCWESPKPTSQPLPLHYADKLAGFTQLTEQAWNPENPYPMFI